MIMNGVNNLLKKQVLCKDDALAESFWAENISDVENTGNIVENLCNEKLHGEMNYISEDGLEGFVGESRSSFMDEERNEEIITKGDEELVARKILNEIMRIIAKGMHMGMMTQWMAMV
jgi:hypothetical protein